MRIFSRYTFAPFKSILASAALLGLVLSILSVVLALLPNVFYNVERGSPSVNSHGELVWNFYGSVVIAPIFETSIIFLLHQLIVRWMSAGAGHFVFAVMGFAALTHYSRGYGGVLAVLAFAFFAFQYVAFAERYGSGPAVIGVTITHSINNLVINLLIVFADS